MPHVLRDVALRLHYSARLRRHVLVIIRPATSTSDLTVVRDLFSEYAASLGVDLGFQDFGSELAGLPGAYIPPHGALLVAEVEGQIVGCIALRPFEPPAVGEIKRLYVRPAGRGLGLGAALSKAILDAAKAAGYQQVRLDTMPFMKSAQALYRDLGFREIPPYRFNPVAGTIFMELDLAEYKREV
jgi:ribosomal protein S18 acetylase RimI-like enzyme